MIAEMWPQDACSLEDVGSSEGFSFFYPSEGPVATTDHNRTMEHWSHLQSGLHCEMVFGLIMNLMNYLHP